MNNNDPYVYIYIFYRSLQPVSRAAAEGFLFCWEFCSSPHPPHLFFGSQVFNHINDLASSTNHSIVTMVCCYLCSQIFCSIVYTFVVILQYCLTLLAVALCFKVHYSLEVFFVGDALTCINIFFLIG